MEETNVFKAVAKAQWAKGDDGEVIARELAQALQYVIHEGKGSCDYAAEFSRLAQTD